jgi:CheY-like chemotaxis protein
MTQTRSVLIVDDEKNIADTVALILQGAGYAAQAAYDGSVALAMTRDGPPDLILTDVLMPGMNGIDLAIAARRQFPSCQVLLFSGQAASADMLEDARLRGHDFEVLAKPIEPDDLLERIADLFTAHT